jgi:hypothetical protein
VAISQSTEGNKPSLEGERLRGECSCGAVAYSVVDEFLYALNCHCSQCRKATGSAFKPFAGIEIDKLRLVRGSSETLRVGEGSAHDIRCRRCGSLLYSVVREGMFAHVTLGTLVDTPVIRPTAHIFVGSKAPWYEITDSLPQLQGLG